MLLLKEQNVCVCFHVFNIVYTWPSDLRMGQHLYAISTVFLQPHTNEMEPTYIFSDI